MFRNAILYRCSSDGRREVYIDERNSAQMLRFLKAEPIISRKVRMVIELMLEGKRPTRALYGRENIAKGCETVWAIKPVRGKKNPRIYCQEYFLKNRRVYILVLAEMLQKKKSNNLSKKEIQLIKKVGAYNYKLLHHEN